MGEVIGTCGHKLRDVLGNVLLIKDYYTDYEEEKIKKCTASICVCDKCAKWYKKEKLVLNNLEEIKQWLNNT